MSYVATLTVPAGTVASTLTGFVTRVDLADLPPAWWADTSSDLGNVRVKQGGAVVPFDIVSYDRGASTGELFFKATLTTGDNVFTVETVDGASALAATDPNGRSAVWSDYDAVVMAPDINRVDGTALSVVGTLGSFGFVETLPGGGHQGMTRDVDGNWYDIDTTTIRKYDPTFTTLLATRSSAHTATGIAGVNHLSDGQVVDGELFLIAETYTSPTYNNQHVTVWDLSDLSFKRSYDISAAGHESSGICYDPDDDVWWVTEYPSAGASRVHRYDTSFNYLGAVSLSASIGQKQGIVIHDGYAWVAGGSGMATNGIWRFNKDGSGAVRVFAMTAPEGMHADPDGTLYVKRRSDAVILKVEPSEGLHVSNGHVVATGLPVRTQWTMGAAGVFTVSRSQNKALLSYGANVSSNATRATLAIRDASGDPAALWNSSDAWLQGASRSELSLTRLHETHDGTTARTIFVDGVASAVDEGTAQRPTADPNAAALFIGAEDTSAAERWIGDIYRAYVRDGVLSADWIAAEVASWEPGVTPTLFYVIDEPVGPPVGILNLIGTAGELTLTGHYDAPDVTVGDLDLTGAVGSLALTGAYTPPVDAVGTLTLTAPDHAYALELYGDYDPPIAEPPAVYTPTVRYDLAMAYPTPDFEEA